ISQIELFDHSGKVVGEPITCIAPPWIAGSAMSTPVERDATQSVASEMNHLILPKVGVKTPAMNEQDRSSTSPVTVVQTRTIVGWNKTACAASRLRVITGGHAGAGCRSRRRENVCRVHSSIIPCLRRKVDYLAGNVEIWRQRWLR